MGRTRMLVCGMVLVLVAGVLGAESPNAPAPAPQSHPIAIVGGFIRSQSGAGEYSGTILIRDGKIVAVGSAVTIPADARRIDATNCIVTPGLIDAHGSLGLHANSARESGSTGGLNILDCVDPFADDWRDAARQGVTGVYAQPGGNLGGSGAVLRIGPGITAESLAIRSPAGIGATLGSAPTAAPQQNSQLNELLARLGLPRQQLQQQAPTPTSNSLTRYAQFDQLRSQFDSAKRYGESKSARRDSGKDLLVKAIKKEIPLRLSINHEDDLRNSLRLMNDFGLRPVYEHVDRAAVIPDEFVASKAGIIVGPLLGGKSPDEVRKLALDGRRWALGTFGDEPRATAGLRLHAAAAVAAGYPRDAVLRAITSECADLNGVGDKLGRISAGRLADLVVFAGDPLDPSAPVRLTISQGTVTYDDPNAEIAPAPVASKAELPATLPSSYVLKSSRLLQQSGEFAPGELVVENGRLTTRSPSAANIPTFDVGEATVTPGLVAGHYGTTGESTPDADASHLRATDGMADDDSKLRHYRDAGFLTTIVAPISTNVLAGLMQTARGSDPTDGIDVGMKFVLTGTARINDRYPVSLAGQFELISDRLSGTPSTSNLFLPPAIRTQLFAQRDRGLQAVLDRKLTAVFEAQSRAEIRDALRLIAEFKLRGVLLLPKQTDELTNEIRQSGVAVIIGSQKPTDYEPTLRGIVALGKANVPLALGGEPGDLRVSASLLANAGLPREAARRALIGQPAAAFGLPPDAGRLNAGDAADFVVWDGDPIDAATRTIAVVLDGQRVQPSMDDAEPAKPGQPATTPQRPRTRRR